MQSRVLPKVLVFNILHFIYKLFGFNQNQVDIVNNTNYIATNNQIIGVENVLDKIPNTNNNQTANGISRNIEHTILDNYFERLCQLRVKYGHIINKPGRIKKPHLLEHTDYNEYLLLRNYDTVLQNIHTENLKKTEAVWALNQLENNTPFPSLQLDLALVEK